MVDPEKYPALTAYLAGLPDGLGSHPGCVAKASIYRTVTDASLLGPDDVGALPAPLRKLVEQPLPVSSWLPEVHSHALMAFAFDCAFEDLRAFDLWAYEQQRALFSGPLYAVAMRLIAPSLLFKTMRLRWGMFHRGVTLQVLDQSHEQGIARLEHPVGVYDEVSRVGLCAGLRAALELSSGEGACTVEVTEHSEHHAVIRARW